MTSQGLNSDDVLNTLSQNRQTIQNFGVCSLALFGSVAVDRATADSDLDFLVEFEGATTFDGYMDLKFFLEDLFNVPVDLVTKRSLKPEISQKVLQEAIMSRNLMLYLLCILNSINVLKKSNAIRQR
ncbi:MAG: nucleotidyltransferase family protein [Cyanobacteria bacterium P01_G01_bin.39]